MRIIVIDGNHIFETDLTGKHTKILLHGKYIVFIYTDEQWKIKVPTDFMYQKRDSIASNHSIILQERETGKKIKLYFNSSEDEIYHKYPWKDHFSIGPKKEDDLSFPENIIIEPKKQIIMTDSMEIALNGVRFHESKYAIGDTVLGKNFKAVLGPDFIMVREPVHTDAVISFQCSRIIMPLVQNQWQTKRLLPLPFVPDTIELQKPAALPEPIQGNLFAMMLPSILMLASTFGIGVFTAYHSYINGREISDVLPMVILPGVMLLSTVCTHPLLRRIQKHQYKKREKKRIQNFQNNLKEKGDSYLKLQKEYYYSLNQNLLPINRLLFLVQKHILPEKTNTILCGWIQEENTVTIVHHLSSEEKELMQSEMIFEKRLRRSIWIPYSFDGTFAILIEGEEKERYFLSMLIQAGFCMEHIALVCTADFIQKYPFVRRLPSLLYEDGRNINFPGDIYEHDSKTIMFTEGGTNETKYTIMRGEKTKPDILFHVGRQNTIYSYHSHQEIQFKPNRFQGIFPSSVLPMPVFHNTMDPSFLDLYEQSDTRNLEIEERWKNHEQKQSRCAVIGMNDYGKTITIDLSEKKEGPHGLIAGTTGSGKSELILTLLLSLMVNYSPEQLQIAFIDFKGGSASHIFEVHGKRLPHIVGCLSNLDSSNTERVLYALKNECIRRQRILKDVSIKYHCSIMKLSDYQLLQCKFKKLETLADLVIVVDEFAELRAQSYEMLNQLISIARIGRSLGIHLLLSTQKPAGIVSDQIWANSHFKICLKVSEKQDSMEVLHSYEAMNLKKSGEFILECDGNTQKGICGYSGYRHVMQKITLRTLKENGKIDQDYAAYGKSGSPEILSVCQKIDQAWKGKAITSLWCEPIQTWPEEDLFQHKAIGIVDDIFQQKQSYEFFQYDAKSHWAFLSDDQHSRNQIIMFCKKLFQIQFSGVKIYSIDTAINREEAILMHQRLCLKDVPKIILIQDTSRFYERDNELKIHDMLEHSQEYNLQCLFFLGQSSMMPYRDLALMINKICLKNENCEDMSNFLGVRVKQSIQACEKGLLYQDHLLSFQMGHRKEDNNV